jgi:hypothetical protein
MTRRPLGGLISRAWRREFITHDTIYYLICQVKLKYLYKTSCKVFRMIAQREENKGVELTGGGAKVQEPRMQGPRAAVRTGLKVVVDARRSIPHPCKKQNH